MIRVEPKLMVVLVQGIHTMQQIEAEIMRKTKWRSPMWRRWTIIGFGEDRLSGITTALPFSPPDVDREEVGFRRSKATQRPDNEDNDT